MLIILSFLVFASFEFNYCTTHSQQMYSQRLQNEVHKKKMISFFLTHATSWGSIKTSGSGRKTNKTNYADSVYVNWLIILAWLIIKKLIIIMFGGYRFNLHTKLPKASVGPYWGPEYLDPPFPSIQSPAYSLYTTLITSSVYLPQLHEIKLLSFFFTRNKNRITWFFVLFF